MNNVLNEPKKHISARAGPGMVLLESSFIALAQSPGGAF